MTYQYITLSSSGSTAEVVLNRPEKYNALRLEMCEEIAHAIESVAARSDIKSVVISGAGKNFCAGFDVASETPATDTKATWLFNRRMQTAFGRINDALIVKICRLDCYVVGAGFLLAAVCNLRYATPETIFYVPELDMGIPFSLGGVACIARYIGITRTTEMVLTCNKITAESPYMQDFVTRVVGREEIGGFVDGITASLAKHPNSILLASLSTLREAEKNLLPDPASDLFTMLFVDAEPEARQVRETYSKKFKS
nr:enoyl-CoA hydratase/isomerase family protein [Pseudomonas sp.]